MDDNDKIFHDLQSERIIRKTRINPWAVCLIFFVLVLAVWGGTYFLTNKSEETILTATNQVNKNVIGVGENQISSFEKIKKKLDKISTSLDSINSKKQVEKKEGINVTLNIPGLKDLASSIQKINTSQIENSSVIENTTTEETVEDNSSDESTEIYE